LNNELAVLYAKRFIQRRDVKAVQFSNGGYSPDRELKHIGNHGPLGFQMDHLRAHLNGKATYGHYLLDNDDNARLFAFDIDLQKTGFYVPMTQWDGSQPEADWEAAQSPVKLGDPLDRSDNTLREAWLDRASPARPWLKYQMGILARRFCRVIEEQTNLPCAAAYSGNKGIHVYGFTGPMNAADIREAALFVLDYMDEWEPIRGQHIFGHKIDNPLVGYQNYSVEVFPKQDSLDGKDLGNLMRLPLGRNLKSPDPTFFLDLKTAPGVMAPHADPVALLESGNAFL